MVIPYSKSCAIDVNEGSCTCMCVIDELQQRTYQSEEHENIIHEETSAIDFPRDDSKTNGSGR